MVNKKCLAIILGFGILCGNIIFVAVSSKKQDLNQSAGTGVRNKEISLFKQVYFYKAYEFEPSFILESDRLEIQDNIYLEFNNPKGLFYNKGSQYRYEAKTGNLNQETEDFNLKGDVRLSGERTDYVSDKVSYKGKEGLFHAVGNVSSQFIDEKTLDLIKIKSNELRSFVSKKQVELKGNVKGDLKRKKIYEGGLKFSAEEVIFNSLNSQMDLSNNVKIHRNNYYLQAGNAQIFLENFNKKLKYYTLYDDVKLEERLTLASGKSQMRKAFAEKLEGVQSTGQVILTGAPRVEQGADVIKGYQITLRENTELIEVDDAQSRFSVQKEK